MPVYAWEWLGDLALIPAWECFLAGVIAGAALALLILRCGRGNRDDEQRDL